jgi:hypothetical protein
VRVFFIAHADEGGLQQFNDGGYHLLAWQTGRFQILLDSRPDGWETSGEIEHAVKFRVIADPPVVRMITILPAAARVHTGSLKMAIMGGTYPDILPGWRQDQRANSLQRGAITDQSAPGIKVGKTFPRFFTLKAGAAAVDVTETGQLRRFTRIIGEKASRHSQTAGIRFSSVLENTLTFAGCESFTIQVMRGYCSE